MLPLVISLSKYFFALIFVYFVLRKAFAVALAQPTRAKYFNGDLLLILIFHTAAFGILSLKYDNPEVLSTPWGSLLCLWALGLLFIIVGALLARLLFKHSAHIWHVVFMLADIGLVLLARITPSLSYRQLMFAAIGLALALLVPLLLKVLPKFELLSFLYLIVGLLLAALPFVLGETKNGARNWANIGGVSFQPSEIVKIFYTLFLASALKKRRFLPFVTACCAAVFIGILIMQNDLGGALIFSVIFLFLSYTSSHNPLILFGGVGLASVVSVIAYQLLPHIRVRVFSWSDPWSDPFGKGHQIIQSLFAITTYAPFGSGLTAGTPNVVPIVQSDFIYAALCEELGIAFGLGVICLFALILIYGMRAASLLERRSDCLMVAGFSCMLAFQAFLIIAGNIKLIPMTGVTLPFISYGGSSVAVSMIFAGFIAYGINRSAILDEPEQEDVEP